MIPLAHLTVHESPLWIVVLFVGVALGMGLAMAILVRTDRNKPR